MSFFCPILLIILQLLQNNLTRQITLIQYSGRSKHTLPFKTKFIKMTYNIKRLYRKNSLLDGTIQSVHSAVMQLCRILNNRLCEKNSKTTFSSFSIISKITSPLKMILVHLASRHQNYALLSSKKL